MEQRRLFVIGPMGDADLGRDARLNVLVREVLQPLFDDIEKRDGVRYLIRTPYDLKGQNIMRDILYEIDRANLVIADATDLNPNVFYEIGITHALGRPCITVAEKGSFAKIPFDLGAYRFQFLELSKERYLEAQRTLYDPIQDAHRTISDWNQWENPVIDFFRAPITYISPAYSLAFGYYNNFVRRVGEALIRRKEGKYIHDIHVGTQLERKPKEFGTSKALEAAERGLLDLIIVIPTQIDYCRAHFVDKLAGSLLRCYPEHDGRDFAAYFRPDPVTNRLQIIDIPTTINVMEDAVDRRMRRKDTKRTSQEWREVERQELNSFALILEGLIEKHDDHPVFGRRVRIARYDPDSPGDLLWLHTIMQG